MAKDKYTLTQLLEDIQVLLGEIKDGGGKTDERAERERQSKLIVMQMLISLASAYCGKDYREDEKLKNAIETKVEGDELLSGFIFFVSQNQQFDFSWNNMRKRRAQYEEHLMDVVRFLSNVVEDINTAVSTERTEEELHIVFGNLIDVTLKNAEPAIMTNMLWENFHKMASVEKGYSISIKVNERVLVAGNRKKTADVVQLIETAMEIAHSTKSEKEG